MRTDIKTSIITLTKPIFPFVPPTRNFPDSPSTPILPKLGIYLTSLQRTNPHLLHPQILICIYDLADLVRYAERCRSKDPQVLEEPSSKSEFFDNQNLYIEYRLLCFPYDHADILTIQISNPLQECIRLALLLFINTALWHGWPPSSAIIRSPLTALWRALESTNLQLFWRMSSDVLLWILFIGANSSLGQIERPWFVELLRQGKVALGLPDEWEGVERRLQGCLYLERVYGEAFRGIWDEVRAAERAGSI